MEEIAMHSSLHHPNMVAYLGWSDTPTEVHILMEFAAGGSLSGFLDGRGMAEIQMKPIARKVASALM